VGPGEIGFLTSVHQGSSEYRVLATRLGKIGRTNNPKHLIGFKPAQPQWCSVASSDLMPGTLKTSGEPCGKFASEWTPVSPFENGNLGSARVWASFCGFLGLLHLEINSGTS